MQNQGQHPSVGQSWGPMPERPNQVSFGDRMNEGDKELSDLLDFSAMFSPPVRGAGGAAPVKVNGQPEPGGMYPHPGYKPPGMSEGGLWNSNQSPSGFEAGRFEEAHRQQFNGNGPERVDHFLGPGPEAGDKGDMYRAGYPGRDGLPPSGMLGNSISPDAMSAGKTTCNTYFPSYNKRQLDDSPRG
ncbi:hypothetical protein EGW08_014726, partial [Elysia chlorotica]